MAEAVNIDVINFEDEYDKCHEIIYYIMHNLHTNLLMKLRLV